MVKVVDMHVDGTKQELKCSNMSRVSEVTKGIFLTIIMAINTLQLHLFISYEQLKRCLEKSFKA